LSTGLIASAAATASAACASLCGSKCAYVLSRVVGSSPRRAATMCSGTPAVSARDSTGHTATLVVDDREDLITAQLPHLLRNRAEVFYSFSDLLGREAERLVSPVHGLDAEHGGGDGVPLDIRVNKEATSSRSRRQKASKNR